jgi:hypothetical protein
MTVKKINISLLLFILISFVYFQCDIFKTRTPEEPSETGSGYQPPTSADIVIENLINAISEKSSLNYAQCFPGTTSEYSFSFVPAPDVQKQYYSVFISWDISSEKSYFENLIAQTSDYATSRLTLNGSFTYSSTDSMIYNADYSLTFNHDVSNISQTASGNLQFAIRRDQNNYWWITRWIDNKVNDNFCWSELKARFSI